MTSRTPSGVTPPPTATPVRVGVVGLGFMGRTHLAAYRTAAERGSPCAVRALCDARADRREGSDACGGNLGELCRTGVRGEQSSVEEAVRFGDLDGMLAEAELDLVSICTPTDTHVELALRALEAGCHVLVEKPVALAAEDIDRLSEAAARAGRHCVPAFCMRFWPGWRWLWERIRSRVYGSVRAARFERLSAPPSWSRDFYLDPARSGDALVDLHIHDADFVRWCFGDPDAVSTAGSPRHLTTLYHYAGGPEQVVTEGGWLPAPAYPFHMVFRVVFEGAVAEYDSRRPAPLTVLQRQAPVSISLAAETGYDLQIRHLIRALVRGTPPEVDLADARGVVQLLDRERTSAAAGSRSRL